MDAYHSLFWFYVLTGLINGCLTLALTKTCEVTAEYRQTTPKELDCYIEESEAHQPHLCSTSCVLHMPASDRNLIYKLCFLLAIDSLADGMVPYSLTNYYIEKNFHLSKSILGIVNSLAYISGAILTIFTGPLVRSMGLVISMLLTHTTSSVAVLLFPILPNLNMTIMLFTMRVGLNNLDQALRSAFITSVFRPEMRTTAIGVTSIVRTLAAMFGPLLTGILADRDRFWIAFVVAGACRLTYDIGLYAMFADQEVYRHERGSNTSLEEDKFQR